MKRLFILLLLSVPAISSSQWLNHRSVNSVAACGDIIESWDGNFIGVGQDYFEEFDSLNTLVLSKSDVYGKTFKVLKSKPDDYLLISNTNITDDLINFSVVKCDGSGEVLWRNDFPSDTLEQIIDAISIGDSVHYLIGLRLYRPVDSDYVWEGLIVKIDNEGNQIWKKIVDIGSPMLLVGVTAIDSSSFIAIGSWGTIIKFDSSGKILQSITNEENPNACHGIVQITQNEFIISGSGVETLIVQKIDSDLNFVWTKSVEIQSITSARNIIDNGDDTYTVLCSRNVGTTIALIDEFGDLIGSGAFPSFHPETPRDMGIKLFDIELNEYGNCAVGGSYLSDYYTSTFLMQELTDNLGGGKTSIHKENKPSLFKVYPNPTKDQIFVNIDDFPGMKECQLIFMNQLGAVVYEISVEGQQYEISTSPWAQNGLYFIQLIDSGGKIIGTEKLIVQ